MENIKFIKQIEIQANKKKEFLAQELFIDELFKCDLSSIGDLRKNDDKQLDPMNNIPTSIRKRIEAKDNCKIPNKINKKNIFDENNLNKYVWKRIGEINQNINLLKILPNEPAEQLISNVIQGHLGNCYFLSAISAFAEQSSKVLKLFPEHYDTKTKTFRINSNGLYEVQAYVNGKPIKILLDDFFACTSIENSFQDEKNNEKSYELAFSIIDEKSNNIWPIILEKAWSKLNGSYGNIIKGNIPQAFNFISPSPVHIYHNFEFYPDKINSFHKILNDADDSNYIICADISNDISPQLQILTTAMGLLRNHAYTIVSIIELEMRDGDIQKLLKIRNPWGTLEWNGDWSDDSQLWTDDLKKKAGFTEGEDGFFYINFEDFLKFFTNTYICTHQISRVYNFKKIKNEEKDSFFYIIFDIKKNIDGYFLLNLKSTKIRRNLKNDPLFENYYFSFILIKQIPVGKNQFDYVFIDSFISNKDRKSIKVNQEAGKYIIFIKINNFDDSRIEKEFIYSMEKFISEKLDKNVSFKIGLYSNINEEDYTYERIDNNQIDVNSIKQILSKSIEKIIEKLPKEVYTNFYEENEKDSNRIMHFQNHSTAFGIFAYNNESSAVIMEKINVNNIQNISFIPILDENTIFNKEKIEILNKSSNSLEIEENIFDDDIENDFLKYMKESEKFETNVELINPRMKRVSDLDHDHKDFLFHIRPNSRYYGILFKNSENTDFDINSKICLKYPLSQIWQEKHVDIKKTKLKFKDTYIPIIETLIKYNNGLLIKYKNKTNEFISEVKINLENTKNIIANRNNLTFIEKIYGEEAEGIIKIIDDTSCMIVLNPGEMVLIEFSSVDLFEEIAYDINFNYNIYTV